MAHEEGFAPGLRASLSIEPWRENHCGRCDGEGVVEDPYGISDCEHPRYGVRAKVYVDCAACGGSGVPHCSAAELDCARDIRRLVRVGHRQRAVCNHADCLADAISDLLGRANADAREVSAQLRQAGVRQ